DLSEFTWIPDTCQGSFSAFLTNELNGNQGWGDITLANFAVNGANGVTDGVDVTNASLGLRDMLVENAAGTGVYWHETVNAYNASIENSALIGNGTGTSVGTATGRGFSVDESTFADNGTALVGSGGGSVNVGGDTIAHNTTGLSGTIGQVVGSIIGDNTTDCATSPYQDFGDNVYGSGSGCTTSSGDATLTSTLGPVSTSGPALTPSISPPSEAAGLVRGGICVATQDAVDQEESSVSALSACYAGSIQPDGTISDPTPENSPQDFGAVPTNEPASANVYLQSAGGLTDVRGVDVATTSGTGHFAVTYTSCEYFLLFQQFDRGNCVVSVTATAIDTSGTTDGTLTFHTGTGDIVDELTFTGAAPIQPPAAPTHLRGSVNSHEIDLSWTLTPPSADGGQAIQFYVVDASTDGGHTWTEAAQDGDTTDDPATFSFTSGIKNNRTYEFQVLANNGFTSSPASNTISVTPEGPATALAAPSKATLTSGRKATMATTMTSLGHPVGRGLHVTLQQKANKHWTTTASGTTKANGTVAVSVRPVHNVIYRWSFAGNNDYAPSTSKITAIPVAPAVTARASARRVARGSTVTIYGILNPADKGRQVTVQMRARHGWKSIGRARITRQKLPNGKRTLGFAFPYLATSAGKQALRVVIGRTSRNAAGMSSPLTVTVH
ncbi:MAG TPA: fibronectin type III domain-containing protein, partial [Mycobacteriales bacterium]|nr:fibronectin type III domain-containing protein [Mycobacteriales bacterium]